jgi:hypothetical protein
MKHPKLSIDGSPKPLGVLRRNFGEMMNTPRRGYALKITASNFLQLPESQISSLYIKNTKNSKTTKIEGLAKEFEGQDHQEKRHTNLMCDSQKNPAKKHLQKLTKKIPRKGFENRRKRQTGETQSNLEEPRRIIYKYHEGSYKV